MIYLPGGGILVMSKMPLSGVFALSIDVSLSRETTAAARAVAVAEHLAAARLPATWALDATMNPELANDLKHADAAHEIAVLADPSWAGQSAQRRTVAVELARRLSRSAAAQAPKTLVLAEGRLTSHVDLLVKHGIHAVRTKAGDLDAANERAGWLPRRRGADAPAAPVRSLRWGLWEIVHSVDVLTVRHGVLTRLVDQVAAGGGLVHLSFDVAALTGKISTGLKLIDRIAAHVAQRREQRLIEAVTISGLTARLSPPRQNLPARSILRPAA